MLRVVTTPLEAFGRLCGIAQRDTGPPRRAAPFPPGLAQRRRKRRLGPTNLENLDRDVAPDMLALLKLARESRRYPGDLGFEPEVKTIRQRWRGAPKA